MIKLEQLLKSFGFSLTGRSHIEKGQRLQDAFLVCVLPNGFLLGAVADGVGSAAESDVGAYLAVNSLADYLLLNMPDEPNALLEAIKNGYISAMERIENHAHENSIALKEYDTTLTAAIFDGTNVYYGHSGDGGIISIRTDGHYELITRAQKGDAYNEVYPLASGEKYWTFGVTSDCAGLLLMTDGVLDVALPPLLNNQPEPLYTHFIHKFLNHNVFGMEQPEIDEHQQICEDYLSSPACAAITDDITVVALWNNANPPAQQPDGYIAEPDWDGLRKERYYKLYPHLRPKPATETDTQLPV